MTWSYFAAGIASSPKDQVRLAIGDTLITDQQLQDEEIVQFLGMRNSIAGACAEACRALASKYSRSVTQKSATSQVNFSDLSKAYLRMAVGFDQKAARGGSGMPYAGGLSVSDKVAQQQDTDRVSPQFNIGMEDNLDMPIGPAGNETEEPQTPLSQ